MSSVEYGFRLGGVPPELCDDCFDWAFGKENMSASVNDLDDEWNKRHGEFIINGSDLIWRSCKKIGKLFLLTHNPKGRGR